MRWVSCWLFGWLVGDPQRCRGDSTKWVIILCRFSPSAKKKAHCNL